MVDPSVAVRVLGRKPPGCTPLLGRGLGTGSPGSGFDTEPLRGRLAGQRSLLRPSFGMPSGGAEDLPLEVRAKEAEAVGRRSRPDVRLERVRSSRTVDPQRGAQLDLEENGRRLQVDAMAGPPIRRRRIATARQDGAVHRVLEQVAEPGSVLGVGRERVEQDGGRPGAPDPAQRRSGSTAAVRSGCSRFGGGEQSADPAGAGGILPRIARAHAVVRPACRARPPPRRSRSRERRQKEHVRATTIDAELTAKQGLPVDPNSSAPGRRRRRRAR